MRYYVLFIWGDIGPVLHGPYLTEAARDEDAKKIRRTEGEEHGLFRLNIDMDGKPHAYPYPASFLRRCNMPTYYVRTLEKFETIAEYYVDAPNADKATEEVATGNVAYEHHEHPGNDDEFVEVLEIEEV